MNYYNIIYSIIAGFILGILKGWLQISVNHLILIVLLFLNLTDNLHHATATISFISLGLALIYAVKSYNKIIDVDTNIGLIMMLFILIGSFIGHKLTYYINKQITNITIICSYIVTIIYLLYYFNIFKIS
jgi:uncharacterized membrane protein YfcA